MTSPPLQFLRTSDDVTIAHWSAGAGPPLLLVAPAVGSSSQAWDVPAARRWYESLAERFTLVDYDSRGWRMSQLEAEDYSLEGLAKDIEAVVDAVPYPTLDVFVTTIWVGPLLQAVASRRSRFNRIVFWAPSLSGPDIDGAAIKRSMNQLRLDNFDAYLSAMGSLMLTPSDDSRHVVEFWRRNAGREAWLAIEDWAQTRDISDLASAGLPSALVLTREDIQFPPLGPSQAFASRLGASFSVLPGRSVVPFLENSDAVTKEIARFLQPRAAEAPSGPFRTVLFTDVENSTDLVVQHGDAKYRELLADHERLVREALATHGGNEIKTIGDSFMCWFSSASAALDAAIAMQRAIAGQYGDSLRIRIGVHAGEPIQEADGDLYGTSVVRASRIMGQAGGGQILVSQVVTDLVEGKGYLFHDAGEFALKGYERPARLFDVGWREEAE